MLEELTLITSVTQPPPCVSLLSVWQTVVFVEIINYTLPPWLVQVSSLQSISLRLYKRQIILSSIPSPANQR
jgi:hypothetical protein